MSDKIGWEGRDQQLGTRIGTVWNLSQALGPVKRRYLRAGVPKGAYSVGLSGAKTEIPVYCSRRATGGNIPSMVGRFRLLAILIALLFCRAVAQTGAQTPYSVCGPNHPSDQGPCATPPRARASISAWPTRTAMHRPLPG
jgi:hypothetical protein